MVRRNYMIDKTKILYTFKKSYNISYNQDYFCCLGSNVNLYDFNSGKFVSKFNDIKKPNYSRFTSNQNLVVKTMAGSYHIYNLVSMNLIKKIPPPKNVLGSITNFLITSDNKYIIDFSYVFPTYELLIIEIETGAYTFFNLGYSRKGFVFPTETNSKYYVVTSCAETIDAPDVHIQEIYELTYTSDKFKLKKLFSDSLGKLSIADYRSTKFVIADYSNKIKLFDAQKGFQDEFEYNRNGVLYDLKLSKTGRYIVLVESQNVYIYNLNNKECIKAYKVDYGCFADFLDDTRLLIGTWEKGYCVSLC